MTPLFVVDAFARGPFTGNPAAVCPLTGPADAGWMQRVATEMNLSETAFAHPLGDGWGLRWFTPVAEVALCGHATLATAHVLWQQGLAPSGRSVTFETLSGPLAARPDGDLVWLDLPALPSPAMPDPQLLEPVLRGTPVSFAGRGAIDLLVELESDRAVREFVPDLAALALLPEDGLIVTARCDDGEHDVVSRYFAPRFGIPEDPATGAAHCAIAPHWRDRLGGRLRCLQASPRGAELLVEAAGDRVHVGGGAAIVVAGSVVAR